MLKKTSQSFVVGDLIQTDFIILQHQKDLADFRSNPQAEYAVLLKGNTAEGEVYTRNVNRQHDSAAKGGAAAAVTTSADLADIVQLFSPARPYLLVYDEEQCLQGLLDCSKVVRKLFYLLERLKAV